MLFLSSIDDPRYLLLDIELLILLLDFFEESVTKEVHVVFIRNELPRLLEDVQLDIRREMWFQQDGTLITLCKITRTLLNKNLKTDG